MNVHNPSTKERKGLMTYYKTYGITCKPCNIAKKFEKIVIGLVKGTMERQLLEKRPNVFGSATYKKFDVKDYWKKDDVKQKHLFAKPWPFDHEK